MHALLVPIHTVVAGRIRLRVQGLYQAELLADWLEFQLKKVNWVRQASANPVSGNLFVRFNPEKATCADVIQLLEPFVRMANQPGGRRQIHQEMKRYNGFSRGKQPSHPWHCLDLQEISEKLRTSVRSGLRREDIAARLLKYGYNTLPSMHARSEWEIFSEQFKNLPSIMLLASAGLSLLTGGLGDGVIISIVVGVNAAVGYRNERTAEHTISSLSPNIYPKCMALRDNRKVEIASEDLVPGDVLYLAEGNFIPADARIISSDQLTVDESTLTGESLPVLKTARRLLKKDLPLADRTNMVFRGTLVTGGSAVCIVVAIGRNTELGKIQSLMGESAAPETPLQKQLKKVTRDMVKVSLLASALILILGIARRKPWLQTANTAISLAVAAIPEGLPTVSTTTLARSVRNLQRRNVIVRYLQAIETMGNIDVICLDKTGTLTMNQMEVMSASSVGASWDPLSISSAPEAVMLARIVALCNEAHAGNGSSTEGALLRYSEAAGFNVNELRSDYPLVEIMRRSEKRKHMITVHRGEKDTRLYALKGNPGDVLDLCGTYMKDGEVLPMTDQVREQILRQNNLMAARPLRVLGVAFVENAGNSVDLSKLPEGQFIWLGLVGMTDPLRPGVNDLIRKLQGAGIRPIMITGDQSATATAIGRQLKLSRNHELNLVDSTHLDQLPPEVLTSMAHQVHVFSRVNPSHKLKIVQALQQAGHIVAMTGDGINDGPALKVADVGIGMGGKGTDVARKVADMVLLTDDLQAIVNAVEEGRMVHDNIRKAVEYIASQNLAEIMFTFLSIASGLGEPLSPGQLLWVNLVTDLLPEIALAQEAPEPNLLKRAYDLRAEDIVSSKDLGRIFLESSIMSGVSLASYLHGLRKHGAGPEARAMAFLAVNTASLFHTWSSRSSRLSIFDREHPKGNKMIPISLGFGLGAELLGVFLPGLSNFLGMRPIGGADLAVSGAISMAGFLLIEANKYTRRPAPPGPKHAW